ncbi:hypothetical protein DYB38_013996 [Aphanomyces astaci]|uniref:Uncharacterized protein n=1 Tax=Aphanomyces astaci TaxID=112090 RepID=A0A397C677_APHAT|nr:hypothetical protein DYB38_013996 [Aphanomyces astaci]
MGIQDHRCKAHAKPSTPPLLATLTSAAASKSYRHRTLTNQDLEHLRADLEAILQEFEPDNADATTATDLLKQYEGLELELVECYRYFYTKDGRPLQLVVDAVERTALCTPEDGADNNNNPAIGRHSLAQALRKRLSLPKPAIATYLNAKLIAKFRKSQGKPSGSKMEGIRGPEVPPPPPPPSLSSSSSQQQSHQRKIAGIAWGYSLLLTYVDARRVLEHKTKELPSKGKLSFRDKVIVFLQKYDMAAVDGVDDLLAYGGKTNEDIWEELQIKYKVNQRSRLVHLFQKYDHDRVASVDVLLEDYAGEVEDMIAYYKAKYADQRRADLIRSDPCTWNPGQANTYQLLPGGQ